MKKCECPSCGKATIPFWQKQFLGPARTITCSGCGARLSVPWLSASVFIVLGPVVPLFGGLAALSLLGSLTLTGAKAALFLFTFVIGAVLASLPLLWLYERYVHLVAK